jgi:hypothetical protein
MKKILLIFTATLLFSCNASKLVRETEDSLNGEWSLTEVSYPDSSGFFDVTLFKTAEATCFESSVWKFVANNNRGTVNLSNSSCSVNQQNIVWSLEESTMPNYLYNVVLKMAEDGKAKKEDQGSRLQVNEVSENTMSWDLNVQYQSKPIIVRLKFIKNQ